MKNFVLYVAYVKPRKVCLAGYVAWKHEPKDFVYNFDVDRCDHLEDKWK